MDTQGTVLHLRLELGADCNELYSQPFTIRILLRYLHIWFASDFNDKHKTHVLKMQNQDRGSD